MNPGQSDAAQALTLGMDVVEARAVWHAMSDLFHEQIPDEYILEVFRVMGAAHQHTFQILTKRPERMRDVMRRISPILAAEGRAPLGPAWRHVWCGVSIENRKWVGRADVLRSTPAAVRFISAEPLLGPLVHEAGCLDDDGRSYWYDGHNGPQLNGPRPGTRLEDLPEDLRIREFPGA